MTENYELTANAKFARQQKRNGGELKETKRREAQSFRRGDQSAVRTLHCGDERMSRRQMAKGEFFKVQQR